MMSRATFRPKSLTLEEADRQGRRRCPGLVVETGLAGRVDFGELFAEVDEPSE